MAVLFAKRLEAEPVRSLGFASIGATYMGIGTAISNPSRILFVQNLTDATLMFSFNGTDDNFPLPANGFLLMDITSNKTVDVGCFIAEGTRIYVKTIGAPSTGSVYLSTFFGSIN